MRVCLYSDGNSMAHEVIIHTKETEITSGEYIDMLQWCAKMFGRDTWTVVDALCHQTETHNDYITKFIFSKEEYATLFILRWK